MGLEIHPASSSSPDDDDVEYKIREEDGGAIFVLESKGNWWHAGFHLTTAIVGPLILALPYAFKGLGWSIGFFSLTIMGIVTFYSYYLMSKVLERCENEGRRHIRFRELAGDVFGSGWMYYFVVFIQTAINVGIGIGSILFSADSIKILYSNLYPEGELKLYHFIAMVTMVMIVLSQLPSFHSLRHINLGSLFLSLGYTFLVVGACIYAGNNEFLTDLDRNPMWLPMITASDDLYPLMLQSWKPHRISTYIPPGIYSSLAFLIYQRYSKNAPPKDYSFDPSKSVRVFDAFSSISILAAIFGNGILPEIQATMAPPATGKMVKGLLMCYTVIVLTFYPTAFSGYWAFGRNSSSNILNSLLPDIGPALAPTWVLGLAVIFIILQLLAIALVYSQVAYEIMEKKSANVKEGKYSMRNLIPRILLRSFYMVLCGFFAAMFPFFGDIGSLVGAIGFIPLDFILPMLLYNMTYKPSRKSIIYWINLIIMVVFSGAGIMGAFSSTRKLILDVHKFKLFSGRVVN